MKDIIKKILQEEAKSDIIKDIILNGSDFDDWIRAVKLKYGEMVPLYHATTKEASEIIDKEGFKLTQGKNYKSFSREPLIYFQIGESDYVASNRPILYRIDVPIDFLYNSDIDMDNVNINDDKLSEYVDIEGFDDLPYEIKDAIRYFVWNGFELDGTEIFFTNRYDDDIFKNIKPIKIKSLNESKKKLFIPRKLSSGNSRYDDHNNSQPIRDGIRINQYTPDGIKTGYWEDYYGNGNLRFKGNYVNGKEEGYWEYYYENGQISRKGYYKNGKQDGYWEEYHYNGRLESKGNYVNGRRNGYWEHYHSYNGRLESKGNYVNSRRNGYWEQYYSNGKLYTKGNYVNGEFILDKSINESEKKKLFIPRRLNSRSTELEKIVKEGIYKFLIENDIKSMEYHVLDNITHDELNYTDIDYAFYNNDECEIIFNNGKKWFNKNGWRDISHSDFVDYAHTMSSYFNYLIKDEHGINEKFRRDFLIEVKSTSEKTDINISFYFKDGLNKRRDINISKTL